MDALVVEDDEDIRVLLQVYLFGRGVGVELAASAAAARMAIATSAPDVLFLDLTLPDEDGLALALDLRAAGLLPPTVVVLSGRRPEELADVLDQLPGAVAIPKPFDLASLDQVLDAIDVRRG